MPTDLNAQWSIDEKIKEHEAAILDLKTRRNSYSMACTLPGELISLVILATRETLDLEYCENWLNVAAVCRQWRSVALDTPAFWSHILMTDSNVVAETVKRTMKLPVSLYWHTRERRADTEMSTIMTLGGQVEGLSIFTRTGLNIYSQHEILQSLQHLKKLSIIRSNMDLYASSLDLTQVPSLQLGTLCLSGVDFFPTAEMTSLRHLTFTDKPWSTTQFLCLLHSLPNVETFMLSELVGPEFIPSSKASMTLPRLQELTLECKDFKKTNLFDLFAYPASCHFSLRCTRGQVDINGLVALELPLSHFASSASPFTNTRAVLKIESWRHQSSCQLALYEGSVPSPVFNLDLPVMERDPSFMDHYIRLLSKLPLKNIPRLAIKCENFKQDRFTCTNHFQHIVSLFSDARDITLVGQTALHGFIHGPLPFTRIQTLRLFNIPLEMSSESEPVPDEDMVNLIEFLNSNAVPTPERLVLDFDIPTHVVERLREFTQVSQDYSDYAYFTV